MRVMGGLLFGGMSVFNAVATWLDSILADFGRTGAAVLDWSELHAGPERADAAIGSLLLAGNLGGVSLVLIVQGLISNPYLSLGTLSAAAVVGDALATRLPARIANGTDQRRS
jgi:hypothetical protein